MMLVFVTLFASFSHYHLVASLIIWICENRSIEKQLLVVISAVVSLAGKTRTELKS